MREKRHLNTSVFGINCWLNKFAEKLLVPRLYSLQSLLLKDKAIFFDRVGLAQVSGLSTHCKYCFLEIKLGRLAPHLLKSYLLALLAMG